MRLPGMVYGGPAAPRGAVVPAACAPQRLRDLQAAVEANCRNLSACAGWMNEDQLFDRIQRFTACYTARDQINDECFDGGDLGHRTAADNAFRGRELCNEYWAGIR